MSTTTSQPSLKIVWSSAIETGDRATDVQHKFLIDIINELAEAIELGKGATSIKKILNLMKQYTEWHFGREEICMERKKCPMAAANKNAHANFLKQMDDFSEEFKQSGGSDEIAHRMYKTLTEWLVNHIQKIDTSLSGCQDSGCAS